MSHAPRPSARETLLAVLAWRRENVRLSKDDARLNQSLSKRLKG